MKVGLRVEHPVYGLGTVVGIEHGKKLGDGGWPKVRQSSIIRISNGASHYEGNFQVSVKFDNGGPQGFAKGGSHDADLLTIVGDIGKKAIALAVESWMQDVEKTL